MTVSRYERRRTRTRTALLRAAAELFAEKGISATTVTNITERADVGCGSLYNHFNSVEEIIEGIAAEHIQGILSTTAAILTDIHDYRMLPSVGARVIMRSFQRDAIMRRLMERPYVFVEVFRNQAEPFMLNWEQPAISSGALVPATDHQSWIRTLSWLILSELHSASNSPNADPIESETTLALLAMRLLGIPDGDVPARGSARPAAERFLRRAVT